MINNSLEILRSHGISVRYLTIEASGSILQRAHNWSQFLDGAVSSRYTITVAILWAGWLAVWCFWTEIKSYGLLGKIWCRTMENYGKITEQRLSLYCDSKTAEASCCNFFLVSGNVFLKYFWCIFDQSPFVLPPRLKVLDFLAFLVGCSNPVSNRPWLLPQSRIL